MTLTARNITEGAGNPAPPPPPPDVAALWADVCAAQRADEDAKAVLEAMDADLPTYGPFVMAAWDRAHQAQGERVRTLQAYTNAIKARGKVQVQLWRG